MRWPLPRAISLLFLLPFPKLLFVLSKLLHYFMISEKFLPDSYSRDFWWKVRAEENRTGRLQRAACTPWHLFQASHLGWEYSYEWKGSLAFSIPELQTEPRLIWFKWQGFHPLTLGNAAKVLRILLLGHFSYYVSILSVLLHNFIPLVANTS